MSVHCLQAAFQVCLPNNNYKDDTMRLSHIVNTLHICLGGVVISREKDILYHKVASFAYIYISTIYDCQPITLSRLFAFS